MISEVKSTPIKYWGGKQQLVPRLLKMLPEHKTYCEPFFGGGALFFAKPISQVEIINDLNDNMINFYKMLKRRNRELFNEVETTLFSEFQHKQAVQLWKNGMSENEIMRAWAVFVLSHQSFSGIIGSSWAYSPARNQARRWDNVKKEFDERYARRLELTQIFCRDAVAVIEACDTPDTFHFVDPPYINTEMGHYDGYTESDFQSLLNVLSKVQGKFLLTTYPSEILTEFTKNNPWNTIVNTMHRSAGYQSGVIKNEVFTFNYTAPPHQTKLFEQ